MAFNILMSDELTPISPVNTRLAQSSKANPSHMNTLMKGQVFDTVVTVKPTSIELSIPLPVKALNEKPQFFNLIIQSTEQPPKELQNKPPFHALVKLQVQNLTDLKFSIQHAKIDPQNQNPKSPENASLILVKSLQKWLDTNKLTFLLKATNLTQPEKTSHLKTVLQSSNQLSNLTHEKINASIIKANPNQLPRDSEATHKGQSVFNTTDKLAKSISSNNQQTIVQKNQLLQFAHKSNNSVITQRLEQLQNTALAHQLKQLLTPTGSNKVIHFSSSLKESTAHPPVEAQQNTQKSKSETNSEKQLDSLFKNSHLSKSQKSYLLSILTNETPKQQPIKTILDNLQTSLLGIKEPSLQKAVSHIINILQSDHALTHLSAKNQLKQLFQDNLNPTSPKNPDTSRLSLSQSLTLIKTILINSLTTSHNSSSRTATTSGLPSEIMTLLGLIDKTLTNESTASQTKQSLTSQANMTSSNNSPPQLEQQLQLKQLLDTIDSGLSKLKLQLTQAIVNDGNQQPIIFELPIFAKDKSFQVELALDQHQSQKNQKGKYQWTVTIRFDFESTGPFKAITSVGKESLHIRFIAEQLKTQIFIAKKVASLEKELMREGIKIDSVNSNRGNAEPLSHRVETQLLIDLKV